MDELPPELLVSIVSLLSVKEGARTSVLSRRWRYIWMYSRVLTFDRSDSLDRSRKRLVKWVDRVMDFYPKETKDEFRVRFNLDNENANAIDRCIEFALRKRVQKLELNFETETRDWRWDNVLEQCFEYGAYTFPNITKHFNNLALSLSLVSLSLTTVDLTDDVMDSFMSNCPTLVHLHIENSKGLYIFRPSCQATRLRHLTIINCKGLSRFEICSPNLVSYASLTSYTLPPMVTKLEGASSLVHLTLGAFTGSTLVAQLSGLSQYFSQLETLTVQTPAVV